MARHRNGANKYSFCAGCQKCLPPWEVAEQMLAAIE